MILSIDEHYSPMFANRWGCYSLKWDCTNESRKREMLSWCDTILKHMEADGDWWDKALTDICVANCTGRELPPNILAEQQQLNTRFKQMLGQIFTRYKYAKIVYRTFRCEEGVRPKIMIFADKHKHKVEEEISFLIEPTDPTVEIVISWRPNIKDLIVPETYFSGISNWVVTGRNCDFEIIELQ